MARQPWIAQFWHDQGGAIAPIYFLALTGIIALAGIGYDYAQVATLDTELQNAADQAALAAATQLDGQTNAITRAKNLAQNYVTNRSLFANDGGASAIVIDGAKFKFYNTQPNAESGAVGGEVTADATAKYVKVEVVTRQARYTLTPILGLIMSPSISASATAGMQIGICRVPPILMCNPNEDGDSTFTVANYIGKGLLLATGGNLTKATSTNIPMAFLNTVPGSNSVNDVRDEVGLDIPPGDCAAEGSITTNNASGTAIVGALNTRFDIYDNNACKGGGSCPPSVNSVKDVLLDSNVTPSTSNCPLSNAGWHESAKPYLPPYSGANAPNAMGHPRDLCHAVSPATCNSVGDGTWDRDLYFKVNYPGIANWQATTGLSATATRYAVYKWEIAHVGQSFTSGGKTSTIGAARIAEKSGKNDSVSYPAPQCNPPGVTPTTAGVDRRTFPIAVVNCGSINGASTVTVQKWINVFIVEPSFNRTRTKSSEVYVEVVSDSSAANSDGGSVQVVRRMKPFLVK